jgi:two-component system, LytTR family, sensor kinase
MNKLLSRSQLTTIMLHLSVWGMFFTLLLFANGQDTVRPIPLNMVVSTGNLFSITLLLSGLFYWNYVYLIPNIYFKKGIKYYLFYIIVSLLAFCAFGSVLVNHFFKEDVPFLTPLPPFLMVITMSLALRLIGEKQRQEKEIAARETETLKSELSFLRSQVSPHFLFNVMNNVVSLARLQPQKVEPTLMKLSSLMRYMLYESDEKKVEIRKEVEYLQAYIDLQALRFDDDVKVVFEQNIKENGLIEPMLFIPFVENAFKHGIGLISNPEINIFLENKSNTLIFKCLNKFKFNPNDHKDDASGIGLKNVQRRLELLYPEKHLLDIEAKGDWFEVNLEIKFIK